MVVVPLIIWAAMAGMLFLVFGVFTGGRATFKQLYAVVVHSAVISTLGTLFVTPLNYFRESLSSATNLGRVHAVPLREQFPRAAGRHGGPVADVVGD